MKFNARQKQILSRLTPFQRAVLHACAKIPEGKTATYSDIARAVGKPAAARAVGNALAKNPLAPFIPCHRVIRSDGSVGGYQGKPHSVLKKMLIKAEA